MQQNIYISKKKKKNSKLESSSLNYLLTLTHYSCSLVIEYCSIAQFT